MSTTERIGSDRETTDLRPPRLGFLGLGWIGRSRMAALLREQPVIVAALADQDPDCVAEALRMAPDAATTDGLEGLLAQDLDGIVIATPSALHAQQAMAALERGVAVFSQKPLGRSALETDAVLAAAQRAGRPFAVDLSYRRMEAMTTMQRSLAAGDIGEVFAAELVFHNAYGPDKPWYGDRELAGGGCLIDLGTHLLDLALWLLDERELEVRSAELRRRGRRLIPRADGPEAASEGREVEDFAVAQLLTGGGVAVRLACSWFLPVGRDCQFECTLYGSEGSLSVENVDGSFYDFQLERRIGTGSELLVAPPDEWGGRALCDWTERLAQGEGFDANAAESLRATAGAIDAIYEAGD